MGDGLLETNFDGEGRIPAIMDDHVHEQLGFVQLVFETRYVHVRVVGNDP
jgi:hypothetical protein